MIPKYLPARRFTINLRALAVTALFCASAVQGATITKNSVGGPLIDGTSYLGGVPPGGTDTALFNNTVTAAQANTLGGSFAVGQIQVTNPGGTITINDAAPGNTLTINGVLTGGTNVGIDMSAATANLTFGVNSAIALGASQSWLINAGRTLVLNSPITMGTNNLTIRGYGVVTYGAGLLAPSTGTGTLTLNGVSVNPVINSTTVPNDVFGTTTSLVMSGAFLRFNNIAAGGTETFAATAIKQGSSEIFAVRTSGGIPVINLGSLTRSEIGGTVYLHASSVSGASGIRSTTANTNGIIGGWAVFAVNSNNVNAPHDFASNGATPGTSVFAPGPTHTTDTWVSGTSNTNVTVSSTIASGSNTNSLRYNTAAATTITLSGSSQITSGGILLTGSVGANNQVITGGFLRGSNGGDLIIHQYTGNAIGGLGTLTINSQIEDAITATALTKAGTGVLILGGSNTFTGGVYINAGEVRLANANALNSTTPNAVFFSNANPGFILSQILSLGGNSVTVSGLNTAEVVATGAATPTLQNANGTPVTLTVSNNTANTYGGTLQDGAGGGSLGLTKTGTGTLTLLGTNSYTGATTVTSGALVLGRNNAPGSSAFSVAGGATLDAASVTAGLSLGGGKSLSTSATSGAIASVLGLVTVSGGTVTTGAAGSTLQIGSFTLNSGALNFAITDPTTTSGISSLISVTGTNGLTINGGVVNLSGFVAASAATYNITYDLFQFNGSLLGTGASALSVAPGSQVNGLTYTFANSGTSVTLNIAGTTLFSANWIKDGSGSWGDVANWDNGVPNAALATANFGGAAPTAANLLRTVSLDGSKTVGIVTFSSPNGESYTITQGTSGGLILDNGTNSATVTVTGTHAIDATAPVTLSSNLAVNVVGGSDRLSINGPLSNTNTGILAATVTKNGAGTLVLGGSNTYGPVAAGTVGTNLNAGTIAVTSNSALGAGDMAVGGNAILQSGTSGLALANNIVIGNGFNFTVDTKGTVFTLAGTIGNVTSGALTVASSSGTGTLILTGSESYVGGTTINPTATLQIGNNTTTGELATTGGVTDNGKLVFMRSDVGVVTVPNAINGSGSVTQNGGAANVLLLNVTNGYTGGTIINTGAIRLGANNAIGTGDVTIAAGASLDLNGKNSTSGALIGGGIVDSGSATAMTLSLGNIGTSGSFSGNILNTTGTISLVKNGLGTQTLTGSSSYSGNTTVNNGTLIIGGSSNLTGQVTVTGATGASNLVVADNVVINSTAALLVGNGPGGAVATSASTLVVRDNASVTAASFTFGNGAIPQSSSVTIQNNGLLQINGAFDLNSTAGSTTNTHTVNVDGGTLAVNSFRQTSQGAAAQNGVIRFNGGIVKALANDTSSTVFFLPAPATNAARTTTFVDVGGAKIDTNGFSITIANPLIHGTGTPDGGLLVSNTNITSGTLTLTAVNTYTGATTINSGATLQLGNGTTGFDGTINASSGITNNNALIFNRFGAVSSGVVISGSGAVTVAGVGSQTLTGTNTYTGATTISSGATLQLGNGSAGNDGTILNSTGITDNGTLIYNRAGDLTSAVAISGSGAVVKSGTGSQTLSAVNTYSGTTTVNAGRLVVSGSLTATSGVSVLTGGTLEDNGGINLAALVTSAGTVRGQGSLGSVNISAGGTLAPGNTQVNNLAGTLTANGNVTLADSTSNFSIRLGVGTAADNDQLLMASGVVSLNGSTLQLTLGGSYVRQTDGFTYVIINGGAAGTGGGNVFAQGSTITAGNGDIFNILYGTDSSGLNPGNDVVLQLQAVPEPGTWALLASSVAMLAGVQRFRRRR